MALAQYLLGALGEFRWQPPWQFAAMVFTGGFELLDDAALNFGDLDILSPAQLGSVRHLHCGADDLIKNVVRVIAMLQSRQDDPALGIFHTGTSWLHGRQGSTSIKGSVGIGGSVGGIVTIGFADAGIAMPLDQHLA